MNMTFPCQNEKSPVTQRCVVLTLPSEFHKASIPAAAIWLNLHVTEGTRVFCKPWSWELVFRHPKIEKCSKGGIKYAVSVSSLLENQLNLGFANHFKL